MRALLHCLLLLPVPLLAYTPAARAQTSSSNVTVHRTQAGELDATGWSNATSTLGDFAVRMPCLFNDFRMLAQDTAAILDVDAVGCRRTDQRKYSASRFKYRAGAPAARKYFAQMSGPRRLEGETARRELTFNGFPAIQVEFQSASRCGSVRSLLVGTDLVTLTAEAPRAACADLTVQAESFFASFKAEASSTDQSLQPPSATPPPTANAAGTPQ